MAVPRGITSGNAEAGLRVEFIARRGLVRFFAWHGNRDGIGHLEVTLAEFVRRLGIDTRAALPERYLLFAGAGRPEGGARDFVGAYATEAEGRAGFGDLRSTASCAWAELVCLDRTGRMRQVCWFGNRRTQPPLVAAELRTGT